MKDKGIRLRPAVADDIDGIMDVESKTFGFDPMAMATREIMLSRINLLNQSPSLQWFWIAEYQGSIVGDIVLQPTSLEPHECTSWATSTDNGTLVKTFNPNGRNIFAVSLAVPDDAPAGTADFLVHQSLILRLAQHMKYYMFCARMPGFEAAHRKNGIRAEEYWQALRRDKSPRDWMLREYSNMFGEPPLRLLMNGYPPDLASGGHGVLFATTKAELALQNLAMRIYRGGIACGRAKKGIPPQ